MIIDWERMELGECIELKNGFAFKSKYFTDNPDDIVLVKGSNLGKGQILWNESKYWKKEDESLYKKFLLQPNDVLLAMDRPWVSGGLKYAIFKKGDPKSFLVQRIACLRSNHLLDQYFLKFLIASEAFARYIESIQGGVGVPHISPSQIQRFKFDLPSLPIQRKIAAILSAYDDLIENNLKRIKLLEEKAQLTYEEWFVRMKFPRHESTPIKTETGLPEGWEEISLSEIGEFLNGYAFKPNDLGEIGMPVIKIKEMKSGVVSDTPRNSGESIPQKYFVKNGDILFSWSATLEVVIWAFETGLLNQHLFKVTPRKGFGKSFVYLTTKNSLKIFDLLTTGATMKHIKRKELDFVKLNKPPMKIMEAFENTASICIQNVLHLSKQNQLLKEARDILLPRLMTGMIDVEKLDLSAFEQGDMEGMMMAAEEAASYKNN